MNKRTIVTGSNPASKFLKDGTVQVEGVELEYVEFQQLHKAFPAMVRELAFDISELAVATFLMARDKDIPVTLLPIALGGAFHHQSLVRLPESAPIEPRDLIGKKVATRAYSQATGLWVRGVLFEEFDIKSSDITWLTTEGAHVIQYEEPPYVLRSQSTVLEMLRSGEAAAAMVDVHTFIKREGVELTSIVPNALERQVTWGERHQTVPINHMLTVQTAMFESDPKAVKALYQAFVQAIDLTKAVPSDDPKDQAISYGLNDKLMTALDLAIEYALEQELITKKTSAEEIFADASVYL